MPRLASLGDNRIAQHADAADLHFGDIAGAHEEGRPALHADAAGRAGHDHVARKQSSFVREGETAGYFSSATRTSRNVEIVGST
jgi:hypothetical protein